MTVLECTPAARKSCNARRYGPAFNKLPDSAWRTIGWREGSNTRLACRFAMLRLCCANGDGIRADPSAEEWLLIEWPEGEAEPTRFWL